MDTIKLDLTLKEAATFHMVLQSVLSIDTLDEHPNTPSLRRLKGVLEQKLKSAGAVLTDDGWAMAR